MSVTGSYTEDEPFDIKTDTHGKIPPDRLNLELPVQALAPLCGLS